MKMTNLYLNTKRLFITVSYLKVRQLYYRLYYTVRRKIRSDSWVSYAVKVRSKSKTLNFTDSIIMNKCYSAGSFFFLNLEFSFEKNIDWNYQNYGKLWTYNLTYFDYLNQNDMTKGEGIHLIYDFIEQLASIKDGLMPFPISLRGLNWIKFLVKKNIKDQKINDSLYAQYMILMDNIEYHILGNHLLENGFSLLFGAYYFQDEKFYAKAKKILTDELEEQILKDGSHFELSPMYHQIMLFRVLDCINLVQNNNWKNQELLDLLISKAEIMLGWLNTIIYENGDIPLLNDSANKIAPMTKELNEYASILKVKIKKIELNDCGYRKIKNERYEMVIDVGNIGPDYIPGHAHSDTFNFELYIKGESFIVDTGLSTYETNERRMLERSTLSHNTVEIDGVNQSEVWGGFRVARRAKIIHLKESENYIEATHDGYKRIGVLHTRRYITNEDSIVIEDSIDSTGIHQGIAYLHFYPGVLPEINDNKIIISDIEIITYNAESLIIKAYKYAPEFNKLIDAFKVEIIFSDLLKMEIKI
ncbi:MAG TPA: alginate lyase family protein [Arcobacter sp.]|nr:alginate lyase family protein [Arcobacter sp.]